MHTTRPARSTAHCTRNVLVVMCSVSVTNMADKELQLPKVLKLHMDARSTHFVLFGFAPNVERAKSTHAQAYAPSFLQLFNVEAGISIMRFLRYRVGSQRKGRVSGSVVSKRITRQATLAKLSQRHAPPSSKLDATLLTKHGFGIELDSRWNERIQHGFDAELA